MDPLTSFFTLTNIYNPQKAAEAAAYGDAMQEQRYRNRLLFMTVKEAEADKSWQGMTQNYLRAIQPQPLPGQTTPQSQPTVPDYLKVQQPVNMLAAQSQPSPLPNQEYLLNPQYRPQPVNAQVNALTTDKAYLPFSEMPPPKPQGQEWLSGKQPPQVDYEAEYVKALSPGGSLFQQDPRRATDTLDQFQVRKSTQTLNQLTLAAQSGKIESEKIKNIQNQMEPLIRAVSPLTAEYEDMRQSGVGHEQAIAALQPRYKATMATLSQIPGFENAAKSMPSRFIPELAYTAKDTYSALEKIVLKREEMEGKRTAADEKASERTPTQYLTPKGLPVAADKKGNFYVNGKPYSGPMLKPKAGGASGDGSGVIPNIPQGIPGEINNAALQGLSTGEQAIVKQLVEYRIPLPSGFALRSPYWQKILQHAAAYDPAFDASQYNVRLKLKNDFASGKSAQNIRSLNTVVGHLDTLSEKSKALSNAPVQLWNAVTNKGLSAMGDKRVVGFNMAANAVESELASLFKGMGATDQEIKAWRQNLNSSQSPKQLKESLDTAVELMTSRLAALKEQYSTGMGKPANFRFLNSKSRKVLQKMGLDVESLDSVKGQVSDAKSSTLPSKAEWMAAAKKANPKASSSELEEYYNKKYGGE